MPRIEEVQLVHWGSLRPDPIPLLIDGINVATGPNGSGKTCFLDGIKLLLGVTSFAPGRSSHRYIFDGGPRSATRSYPAGVSACSRPPTSAFATPTG
jgi:DNA repair exonuclease SbcCD ATPase subunit